MIKMHVSTFNITHKSCVVFVTTLLFHIPYPYHPSLRSRNALHLLLVWSFFSRPPTPLHSFLSRSLCRWSNQRHGANGSTSTCFGRNSCGSWTKHGVCPMEFLTQATTTTFTTTTTTISSRYRVLEQTILGGSGRFDQWFHH